MNERALSEYFSAASQRKTKLGDFDCVRFAVESLYIGWGIDYRNILGYSDRRSAVDRLRIAGGLEQAFTDELGDTIDGALLKPGDIAYFHDPAVGIVLPNYVAVKLRGSIGRIPFSVVPKGWRTWVQ